MVLQIDLGQSKEVTVPTIFHICWYCWPGVCTFKTTIVWVLAHLNKDNILTAHSLHLDIISGRLLFLVSVQSLVFGKAWSHWLSRNESWLTTFASFQSAALSDFQPPYTYIRWCPWKQAWKEMSPLILGRQCDSSVYYCQSDIFMLGLYVISFKCECFVGEASDHSINYLTNLYAFSIIYSHAWFLFWKSHCPLLSSDL